MGENSKIEWTHHTFNPWRGCVKVSAGCDHCYAERQSKRNPSVLGVWGADGVRVAAADSYWAQPVSWDRKAAAAGERRRVFCASLADICEILPQGHPSEAVVEVARLALMSVISLTPHLDWLLLTKRPQNAHLLFPDWWRDGWPRNVWLGVSVENQAAADERIPLLLQVPAAVRFLSCEPLLSAVDLRQWMAPKCSECGTPYVNARRPDGTCAVVADAPPWGNRCHLSGLHWVIVGGESGPGARPMHPDWARGLRDQCQAAGVPFFFKQWGSWFPSTCIAGSGLVRLDPPQPINKLHRLQMWDGTDFVQPPADALLSDVYKPGAVLTVSVDKRAVGRELDGRTWDQFPEVR